MNTSSCNAKKTIEHLVDKTPELNKRARDNKVIFAELKNVIDEVKQVFSVDKVNATFLTKELSTFFECFMNTATGANAYADFLYGGYSYAKESSDESLKAYFLDKMYWFTPYQHPCFSALVSEKVLEPTESFSRVTKSRELYVAEYLDYKFDVPLFGDSHGVFNRIKAQTIPSMDIYELEGCELIKYGRLIATYDSSGNKVYELTNKLGDYISLKNTEKLEPYEVKGKVFFVEDQFSVNAYAHFVLDFLPRIAAITNIPEYEDYKVLMEEPTARFVAEYLKFLELEDKVVFYPKGTKKFKFQTLLMSNVSAREQVHPLHFGHSKLVDASKRMFQRVKKLIPADYFTKFTGINGVYLSREGERGRCLKNEGQLHSFMTSWGILVVNPGKLSLLEQVSLFSQAKIVLGVHGGAFSNIVYCEENTSVIEIFPPNGGSQSFAITSKAFGFDYGYLTGSTDKNLSGMHNSQNIEDVEIDIDELKTKLSEFFASKGLTRELGNE